MDNQNTRHSTVSFKGYLPSFLRKIFSREDEATGPNPEDKSSHHSTDDSTDDDGRNEFFRPVPAGYTMRRARRPLNLWKPEATGPFGPPMGFFPPSREPIGPSQHPTGFHTASLGGETKVVWVPTPGENSPDIYKAALTGDWETADKLFQQDGQRAQAIISSRWETTLHVAVGTGKANDFVRELLRLLPDEALAFEDCFGDTALHYAARVGNEEAAAMLVDLKPHLQYIMNSSNRLPVQIAAIHCQKEMLTYLIRKSDPLAGRNNPFIGDLGLRLLMAIIASEYFDVALDLVDKYPELARWTIADGDDTALSTLARMSSAFPHGESLGFWHNFIYSFSSPKFKAVMSKVVLHLVPRAKSIARKKEMHQQALELVNSLCQNIASSLPYHKASDIFGESIILAAKHGNHEVVRVIADIFPTSIFAKDSKTGRDIFSLAAVERHENVFNLIYIYDMSDRKFNFYDSVDHNENNFMHLCAVIAPSHKLNLVAGPALQMQRELQWFKEVEKFVHPSRREWTNNKFDTPTVLFSEKHQTLKMEGEAWMRSTANSCSVAAALVATIMFAAAFTVPGGVSSESGIPIFRDKVPFLIFVISDAVSLFTSLTSLLMFLSILTSRYAEEDFLYVLPKRSSIGLLALFISVTFMIAAFGAAMYLMLVEKHARLLIPVAALACLPVASFVLLQFPLLIDVVYATYGPGIFGKKTGKILY